MDGNNRLFPGKIHWVRSKIFHSKIFHSKLFHSNAISVTIELKNKTIFSKSSLRLRRAFYHKII